MRKSIHGTAVAWVAVACLAGCTVGPNYKRPAYPTPPAFAGQMTPPSPVTRKNR